MVITANLPPTPTQLRDTKRTSRNELTFVRCRLHFAHGFPHQLHHCKDITDFHFHRAKLVAAAVFG